MVLQKKRGQVWVETVLYLVIGLAIIGAVLAFVKPKIAEIQDKIIIDQSLDILKKLDIDISQIWDAGEGNKQIEEIEIKKGELVINGTGDEIIYILEKSKVLYSQLNTPIKLGKIDVLTEKRGGEQNVYLRLKYENLDLLYDNEEKEKSFLRAATAYRISMQNNGTAINIKEV
ncbi:MAG: hypothetical protein AABY22_09115 [Nanoarchaeota archaeon]